MSPSNDPEPVPQPAKRRTSKFTWLVAIAAIAAFVWMLIPNPRNGHGYDGSRMQASNNLKQIGLGIQNYDSAMGSLPPQAICDKDGKPLLSWRVAILQYVELDQLYAKFKLDEPWDSDHNKALIGQIPKIYLNPMKGDGNQGLTYCKVFTGKGTIFDTPILKGKAWVNRLSCADLQNSPRGTANLLLCIEAGDPVVWTKPEDWEYAADQPLPDLKPHWKSGFLALKVDGAVISIPKDFKQSALRASLDPNSSSKEMFED